MKQILTTGYPASAKTLPTAPVYIYSTTILIMKHPDDSPLLSYS